MRKSATTSSRVGDPPEIRSVLAPGAATPPKWESANLDLVRTIAVLCVVFVHVREALGWTSSGRLFDLGALGDVGVQLFFVHTSIVLMMSLERQQLAHTRHSYWVFVVRRAFRLLPLSMFVTLLVCAIRLPVAEFGGAHAVAASFGLKAVLANLFLVQNVTHATSVMTSLWTLPYEMQMYLTLPLLFLLAQRTRSIVPLLLLWAGSVAAFMLWRSLGIPNMNLVMFVPCFVSGIIGYRLMRNDSGRLPFVALLPVLAVPVAWLLLKSGYQRWWCFCLVVGLLLPQFQELKSQAVRAVCRVVARYSYGVYLSHAICIWLAFFALATEPLLVRWVAFVLSASIAPVILYHAIESPMIALGSRVVRRWGAQRALPTEAVATPVL
jgi:peptidoglycan/LPS O-acetylase OafA/YrhL